MKKLFFITLMLLPFSALASPVLTVSVIPSKIHVYDIHGNTYVDLVATGCSGKRFKIPTGHVKYDTIISILLSAQIAQKEVIGRFDGCNSINQGNLIGVYLP